MRILFCLLPLLFAGCLNPTILRYSRDRDRYDARRAETLVAYSGNFWGGELGQSLFLFADSRWESWGTGCQTADLNGSGTYTKAAGRLTLLEEGQPSVTYFVRNYKGTNYLVPEKKLNAFPTDLDRFYRQRVACWRFADRNYANVDLYSDGQWGGSFFTGESVDKSPATTYRDLGHKLLFYHQGRLCGTLYRQSIRNESYLLTESAYAAWKKRPSVVPPTALKKPLDWKRFF